MATGAGKTFTACTLSYRLLANAGFRRILFLADRANLVRQTRDEYLAYRPPGTGRSFAEIYNVQKLGAAGLDKDAQVVIATIQRVYSVLTGKELSEEEEEASRSSCASGRSERLVAYNPVDPDRELRPRHNRRMPPLDLRHVAAGAGIFRRLHGGPDRDAIAAHARLLRQAISSRNIPMSVPSSMASMSASKSSASAPRSASAAATVKAGYDLPVRDKRTRAERYETLDAGFQLHARPDRSLGAGAEPNPHRARNLPRHPVHRTVSRPRAKCRRR